MVAQVLNSFPNDVLPFKELVWHQLTVVFLRLRDYACHGVVYGVCRPVADICQIIYIDRAKTLLDEILFHSRHLTEQGHFLGVCDPHIGFCVGGCAAKNDERTRVSRINKGSGIDECVL